MKICDECETVAHCTKHGCIPKVSAKDAMKLAINALNCIEYGSFCINDGPSEDTTESAIAALRSALEEQPAQQEPVAWVRWEWNRSGLRTLTFSKPNELPLAEEATGVVYDPLYAAPQPAQQEPWSTMPLTELEFKAIRNKLCVQQDGESWDLALKDGINNLLLARFTAHNTSPQPAQRKPLTAREIELIDGMIEVQLDHAARCDNIPNRVMAEKQKGWDMERVELLRKLKEKNT